MYVLLSDLPVDSSIGGVAIFVSKKLRYRLCPEFNLDTNSKCKAENIWIEIEKFHKKFVIGGIYRHPAQSILEFQNNLNVTLQKLSAKRLPVMVAGDINIDLLKYSINNETQKYIDNLLMNNFLPLSLLPTRITEKSATIIDHM